MHQITFIQNIEIKQQHSDKSHHGNESHMEIPIKHNMLNAVVLKYKYTLE